MKYLKLQALLFFFCFLSIQLQAQLEVPQVKNTLDFAGMKLHLTDQARRDIQASVDALYRSEKHFNIMLEKVDLYMPLIEPVFEEHGVPNEFKYLVIQESALVADAISSSNAVGFWQFKESSATELHMRVDRQVDERMNIISATEGAAKYLLRSNAEFDNWLYTLQSYMMGQGGTSRSVDKRHYGAREMKVDGDTHWYVKKFLSHMVAFENAIGKQSRNIVLYQYNNTGNKSLDHIADEFDTDKEQLLAYNKWLKASHIPDDKSYAVIIPLNLNESEDLLADLEKDNTNRKRETVNNRNKQQVQEQSPYPTDQLGIVEFNDLKAIVAREGDSVEKLAQQGDISERRFRKFNDLESGDRIQPGQIYYLEKKHRKARVHEHVLQQNENLWEVSQRYGLRLKKLKQKNRLRNNEQAKAGRVLWLRYIRPSNEPVEHRDIKEPKKNLYASTKVKAPETATEIEQEVLTAEKPTPFPVQTQTQEMKDAHTPGGAFSGPANQESIKNTKLSGQALYPSDTPAPEQKIVEAETQAKINPVQKDTTISQMQESKVQQKNEENKLSSGENSIQQGSESIPASEEEDTLPEAPFEEGTASEAEKPEDESFSVDEPINFVEAEKEQAVNQKDSLHQVQAGETLYSLSRKYGVSVPELIRWNELPAQPVISIGQQLRISPPETSATPTPSQPMEELQQADDKATAEVDNHKYHTVSAGESMYRVARMYNVTIKDIMQWNNKENFDIKEGEQLIVGKSNE